MRRGHGQGADDKQALRRRVLAPPDHIEAVEHGLRTSHATQRNAIVRRWRTEPRECGRQHRILLRVLAQEEDGMVAFLVMRAFREHELGQQAEPALVSTPSRAGQRQRSDSLLVDRARARVLRAHHAALVDIELCDGARASAPAVASAAAAAAAHRRRRSSAHACPLAAAACRAAPAPSPPPCPGWRRARRPSTRTPATRLQLHHRRPTPAGAAAAGVAALAARGRRWT
jgi:hypothetical protein